MTSDNFTLLQFQFKQFSRKFTVLPSDRPMRMRAPLRGGADQPARGKTPSTVRRFKTTNGKFPQILATDRLLVCSSKYIWSRVGKLEFHQMKVTQLLVNMWNCHRMTTWIQTIILRPPTEFPVPLDPEMVKFLCFYIIQEEIWGLSLGFRYWWNYATLGSSNAGSD